MSTRAWISGLWVTLIAVIVGCSGKAPPADAPAVPTAAPPPVTTAPAVTSSPVPATDSTAPPPAVDPNKPETKWIGNIPYDVFYDQPLVVASDSTPVNGGGGGTNASPPDGEMATAKPAESGGQATTPVEAAPQSAGAKPDWSKVISLDLAQEAVKVARSELNASLQGIPKYNAGLESIQINAALMGMMAVVVAEHPEAANWKEKAKYIRDLCYEIQGKATEKGSERFKATRELFEQITGMLDGGKPPEKESQDSLSYVETADRADMMKIIDKMMNDLKANIGDAKRMKDQSAEITRQMAIMRTLGVMMSDASYDHADNEEYQQFTKVFIDGAAQGVDAVASDKFDDFQSALNKMNTSCNECHPKFRGQDSGN